VNATIDAVGVGDPSAADGGTDGPTEPPDGPTEADGWSDADGNRSEADGVPDGATDGPTLADGPPGATEPTGPGDASLETPGAVDAEPAADGDAPWLQPATRRAATSRVAERRGIRIMELHAHRRRTSNGEVPMLAGPPEAVHRARATVP